MMKLDDKIRQLTARETEVPASLQQSVRREIRSRLERGSGNPRRRRILLPAVAAGLALVLLFPLVLIRPPAPDTPGMNEIRTELYLPEHDIKVIWIQNNNFTLRRKKP